MKLNRNHLLVVLPFVLVVLASSLGFRQMERDRNNACHQRAADRAVLTQVVDTSTGNATGPVDLTKIGGFDSLDPSTQAYLRNLSIRLSSANKPNERPLHDRLIDLLPPIRC